MQKIQKVIGMPPESHVSESLRLNSMPILEITPCIPQFQSGLSIFTLKAAWEGDQGYEPILNSHGFEIQQRPIRVAYIADNFPTDSFTNEYGESFLNRTTDMVSSGAAELNYIAGGRSASESLGNIKKFTDQFTDSNIASAIGGIAGAGQSAIEGVEGMKGFFGTSGKVLDRMLAGARIDFPQVWKNSSFSPQYSVTVRLWNPAPGNRDATEKYIVGPIAALLLLCLPITKEGYTYNWPFLHKIRCRGIFDLKSAFISNVSIIKGGDQQQIGWNQRLGIVDVRMDFGSLYSNMIAGEQYDDSNKPTLQNYLDNLLDEEDLQDIYALPPALKSTSKIANYSSRSPLSPTQLAQIEIMAADNAKKAGQVGFSISGPDVVAENYYSRTAQRGDPLNTKSEQYAQGFGEDVTTGVDTETPPSKRASAETARQIAALKSRTDPNFIG